MPYTAGIMVGGGTHVVEGRIISEALDSNCHSNSSSPKAFVLELVQEQTVSAGWPDIIQIVPTVKILNLSKNEVGRGKQIKVGVDSG